MKQGQKTNSLQPGRKGTADRLSYRCRSLLDSGIFPHEDLKDQIRAFRDFTNKYQLPYDETGHGTHVCGILAGNGRVLHGKYKGMAPCCDLYVGKILNKRGEGSRKHCSGDCNGCCRLRKAVISVLSIYLSAVLHLPARKNKESCMSCFSMPMKIIY